MKHILYILLFTVYYLLFTFYGFSRAEDPKQQVGIDEKLGQIAPLDVTVFDEYGKSVKLRDLTMGKPIVLTLVYYRCPGLCSPLLNGFTKTIDKCDLIPGKDYAMITVSFDPRENYEIAVEKKKNYLNQFKIKQPGNDDWRFLTADSANIARLTDGVGFRYMRQGEDYVHGAVVTVLSPDGKIARYLYGTDFLPFDFKLAVIEASEGRVGTTISKVVSLCYSYDAEGKRYALDVTRLAGGGILFLLTVFVIVLFVKRKKN